MNREMRRLQEREERRRKKEDSKSSKAQRRAAQLQSKTAPGERKSVVMRIRDYLHDVRQELRKVTWPTREQMVAFTTVTVITSVALTAVIFGLDVVAKEAVLKLVELRS